MGGLDMSVTEDMLRAAFSPYGELVYVKIPVGKGCGFVQFLNRCLAPSLAPGHSGHVCICATVCTKQVYAPVSLQISAPCFSSCFG